MRTGAAGDFHTYSAETAFAAAEWGILKYSCEKASLLNEKQKAHLTPVTVVWNAYNS
jgi:hypothetical protein